METALSVTIIEAEEVCSRESLEVRKGNESISKGICGQGGYETFSLERRAPIVESSVTNVIRSFADFHFMCWEKSIDFACNVNAGVASLLVIVNWIKLYVFCEIGPDLPCFTVHYSTLLSWLSKGVKTKASSFWSSFLVSSFFFYLIELSISWETLDNTGL